MCKVSMHSAAVGALLISTLAVHAQGTTSATNPAGDSSVTTGIGSGSTVTTHPPLPGLTPGDRPAGAYSSVPDDSLAEPKKPDENDSRAKEETRSRPAPISPAAKAFEERNTIARDRFESPHDQ